MTEFNLICKIFFPPYFKIILATLVDTLLFPAKLLITEAKATFSIKLCYIIQTTFPHYETGAPESCVYTHSPK